MGSESDEHNTYCALLFIYVLNLYDSHLTYKASYKISSRELITNWEG